MDVPERLTLQRVTEWVAIVLVAVAGLGAITLLAIGIWTVIKLAARV